MGSDDYAPIGGSLRLKGGVVKKKSKKKKKVTVLLDQEEELPKAPSDRDEPEASNGASTTERKDSRTDAERKFEETKRKRLDQKLLKDAGKTHKERVEDFNKKLANLSEHHDMPRIGPG